MKINGNNSIIKDTIKVYGIIFGLSLLYMAVYFIVTDLADPSSLSALPSFNPFSNNFDKYDPQALSLILNKDETIDSNIVLVSIGKPDVKGRAYIANIIEVVSKYKPRVIAVDAVFWSNKDNEGDSLLESALSKAGGLVLASRFDFNSDDKMQEKHSNSRFSKNGKSGYINLIPNDDNIIVKWSPFIINGQEKALSFSSQVIRLYDSIAFKKLSSRGNPTERIFYCGNSNKFPELDLSDSTQAANTLVKDKIVLIGNIDNNPYSNTISNETIFKTPLSIGDFPDMPEMIIQANILSMILHSHFLHEPNLLLKIVLLQLIWILNIFLLCLIYSRLQKWYSAITIPYIIFLMAFYTFMTTTMLVRFQIYYNPFTLILFITVTIPFVEIYFNVKGKFLNELRKPFRWSKKIILGLINGKKTIQSENEESSITSFLSNPEEKD